MADATTLTMPPASVDVCVVGAGPVGGTLACRLAASGVSVAVIDRAPLPPMEHPDFDGRAYAIAEGSRALLIAAGLWHKLPQQACPIHGIRVSDGRVGRPASPLFLHFGIDEVAPDASPADESAAFGWMVEARSLRRALNSQLHATPGIAVLAPADPVVQFSEAGAVIRACRPDGMEQAITARLVVAADGRESRLRRQAGIQVTRLPYDQTGIVCAIAHAEPHNHTALEHFLPAGPFAQLPMGPAPGAEHVSAIVWTERRTTADRILKLDDTRFGGEIARRLGRHLGPVRPIGRRWSYRLGALHAHRYTAPRLVLVGDAAHAIHPIAGQGLNLGFRDVIALADLLIAAVAEGADPGDAALLMRYQRARRPDNLLMLGATDLLDRLFSTDNPVLRLARDIGIAAVHRAPPVKRFFMRRAMGLTG